MSYDSELADLRAQEADENARGNHNLIKNLSKSFADLYCEFTSLKVTIQKLEARVLELEREAAVREAVEVEKEIQAMEDNL